jgi:hypothetical protein
LHLPFPVSHGSTSCQLWRRGIWFDSSAKGYSSTGG